MSHVHNDRMSPTLYDSVLDEVVANGAYRAINMATFSAGFKLASLESPSKYRRPPGRRSAVKPGKMRGPTLCQVAP